MGLARLGRRPFFSIEPEFQSARIDSAEVRSSSSGPRPLMPGPRDPALSPFSGPDLAGLELRGDQAEEGGHGQVESTGLLPKSPKSAIVEAETRLLLQLLRGHWNRLPIAAAYEFVVSASTFAHPSSAQSEGSCWPEADPVMTRDLLRDLEALGSEVVICWFCPDCLKAIPILDEKTFEHDPESHRKRYRVPLREEASNEVGMPTSSRTVRQRGLP